MDDEYEQVTKKPLKIVKDGTSEKARKKNKDKTKPTTSIDPLAGISEKSKIIVSSVTKAQQAFLEKQEKNCQDRILKKAAKTHKQRVEEFNRHLDSLSEHYDIPKVSWTK